MENAYVLKAEILTRKYKPYLNQYAACRDDRRIMYNIYNQLIAACKAMEPINNSFIHVAFNQHFAEHEKKMEEIVGRFTGLVYRGHEWVSPNATIFKVMKDIAIEDHQSNMQRKFPTAQPGSSSKTLEPCCLMETTDEAMAQFYANKQTSYGNTVYLLKELPDGTICQMPIIQDETSTT